MCLGRIRGYCSQGTEAQHCACNQETGESHRSLIGVLKGMSHELPYLVLRFLAYTNNRKGKTTVPARDLMKIKPPLNVTDIFMFSNSLKYVFRTAVRFSLPDWGPRFLGRHCIIP